MATELRPGKLRHSLLLRLVAASGLVAICSITATAWLAAQSTSTSIRQELGNAQAGDARTYQALIDHAVTHRTWDGVPVADLAKQANRRIIITTPARQLLADSGGNADLSQLPRSPSAVINPLELDLALGRDVPADRIDRRLAGPFSLTESEKRTLDDAAILFRKQCAPHLDGPIGHSAGGRPLVTLGRIPVPQPSRCEEAIDTLLTMTPTETTAFTQLKDLLNTCRAQRGQSAIDLDLGGTDVWTPTAEDPDCLASARRTQLSPFIAPPALLFVTDPAGQTTQATVIRFDAGRIALVTTVVFGLTVGVSVLVATRLIRPLGTLTAAAERMRHGETAPVDVRSRGEIGQLARAFNDMAEHRARIDAQRKAMTSDVSHELRNPLGTIRSWLEGARDGVVELDRAKLTALLDEALVLQHLVDDLQDLAMVDAGELRLHPEAVDVRELLDQLAAAHANVTVAVAGQGHVHADPVRLRQILTNLVANALRYTPSDGVVRLTADGNRITVSDTGIGIAADDLPHVFDRFWRADPSRARETGGSGLGLAIVHGLVRAHGGTIDVTSTPGVGTTFTIELPATQRV